MSMVQSMEHVRSNYGVSIIRPYGHCVTYCCILDSYVQGASVNYASDKVRDE